MTKFAQVGDFCPDETCPDYGKRQSDQQHNIIKYGKTKTGRHRYKCKTCGATFTETKGTIFYCRRTPEDEIINTLALIAERRRNPPESSSDNAAIRSTCGPTLRALAEREKTEGLAPFSHGLGSDRTCNAGGGGWEVDLSTPALS